MSLFNKNLICYSLLIFILVLVQCSHPKKKIATNEGYSCGFERNSFIVEDTLYANKLVCFFTSLCCPTCVLEVKKYSESIIDCPSVLFFTDKIDSINLGFYSIISPREIEVDTIWANIEKPLLFQTDKNGMIYNLLEIEYNKPYEVREYLLNTKMDTLNY